jgi:ribosomal-protein-alanine N-acetyltransferase
VSAVMSDGARPGCGGSQGLDRRAMTGADLDAVMTIENAVYPFPWTRGNFADSISAGHEAWVLCDANGVAAYAVLMWLPEEIHLLNITIAVQRQRQGLGRALLRDLCADAGARGARSMLLEVRPSNAPARQLYAAEGFGLIGTRRLYYPAPGGAREDALVLRKEFQVG